MPSVMQRVGTPNARHNLDQNYRKQLEHVDPQLMQHNEVIRQKSVEEIYEEHLQPAFDKYNEKQKRRDRRLDVKYGVGSYLEYQRALDEKARASKNVIDQKGRPPIRELILQYGNPEQGFGCKDQTAESRERAKALLVETFGEIEAQYPQLKFGDVVFHADEVSEDADGKILGSFHLHCSFVPICYENKQGPEAQVAFERCLKEMGFATFEEWKHELDQIMEDVLNQHGMERTVMENNEDHIESTEFHRQQKLLRQTKALEKEYERVKGNVEELQAEEKTLSAAVKPLREAAVNVAACEIEAVPARFQRGKSIVDDEDLEELKKQARAYAADADRSKRLDDRERAVETREQAADQREKRQDSREQGLNSREYALDQRERKVKTAEDLPAQYDALSKWSGQLWNENQMLRRLLGIVKQALEKLMSGKRGALTAAQAIYAKAMVDEIGTEGRIDVKQALEGSPIDARAMQLEKAVKEKAAMDQWLESRNWGARQQPKKGKDEQTL